jgi:hypothetical protein
MGTGKVSVAYSKNSELKVRRGPAAKLYADYILAAIA